jgi:hypothetical protein
VGDDSTIRVSLLRSVPGPNLDFCYVQFPRADKGIRLRQRQSRSTKKQSKNGGSGEQQLREVSLTLFSEDWHVTNCETSMARMSPANDDNVFMFATSMSVL